MADRLILHEKLCKIINMTEPDGDRHVYFNPPANKVMQYPAIRYKIKNIKPLYANNSMYARFDAYEVVLIEKKSDSEFLDKILKLPNCRFERAYKADNLNHHVFTIYS